MKVVIPEAPQHLLEWRARTGADRWDEMWEGVLHMPPAPNKSHQRLEGTMERWLWDYWAEPTNSEVDHQINVASVGGWPNDYRIPDLVLLTPDRSHIDHNEYYEGAPTVVVEIRSEGDETFEKLAFYAKIGVPEVWIVDRDTKAPEVHVLTEGEYATASADQDGWLHSPATGVRLRGENGKLGIQMADDEASRRLLPEV